MKDRKISNERRLNENILELKAETLVIDKDTKRTIPGIVKKKFSFSCPYRVSPKGVYVARGWGRNLFDVAFSTCPKTMTKERAEHYAQTYMHYSANRGKIVATRINCAIFEQPKPALDNGNPLNAFEVKGFLYDRTD